MKKETRLYFKNAVQSKGFAIDVVNMILGIAVIVVAVLALTGGDDELYLFPCIFVLGAVMSGLNSLKMMKQNKVFGIFFAVFAVVLAAECVFSFLVLFHGLTIS